MAIFTSEADMQAWLSSELANLDGLAELITNLDEFDDLTPKNFSERRLLESIRTCIASLYSNDVISQNENISVSANESLKPDFVLYALETESVVIVELKNLAGPSRQAGTELAAYACEIRSAIPFIADGDIVNVLISSDWPTLLKHYARQEIFWQHRNLICLQPISHHSGTKLQILGLGDLLDGEETLKVSERHLGGYQICLYDDQDSDAESNQPCLSNYEEQFRTSLQAMATKGNRINSHGFAILWKDRWSMSLAPYSITVMNFAPFQSVERFLHLEDRPIPEIVHRFMNLVRNYDPEGHGSALSAVTDAAEAFLSNVCTPRLEGFAHWGAHREIMKGRAQELSFVGWGLFEEAVFARLQREYEAGHTTYHATDPSLGLAVVSEIVDDSYEFCDLSYVDFEDDCLDNKD